MVRWVALAAGAALLAACSEQDRRTVVLSAAVQACVVNLESRLQDLPVAQGVDRQRLCGCFVERLAAGRSLSELSEIFTGNGPLPDTQALTQCAMEEGRRSNVLINTK